MIVIIDNYDSFTYNLVDLVRRSTADLHIVRNDELRAEEIAAMQPQGVLISPGPGRPEESKVSWEFARNYYQKFPILGVCLGHQILGQVLGTPVIKAPRPMHGKTSKIYHEANGLFSGLPSPLEIMRYHSLLLDRTKLSKDLIVSAETSSGEIMGIRHEQLPLTGLQFHPESILSQNGSEMIHNWLSSLHS